jgi:hypothetical protein
MSTSRRSTGVKPNKRRNRLSKPPPSCRHSPPGSSSYVPLLSFITQSQLTDRTDENTQKTLEILLSVKNERIPTLPHPTTRDQSRKSTRQMKVAPRALGRRTLLSVVKRFISIKT